MSDPYSVYRSNNNPIMYTGGVREYPDIPKRRNSISDYVDPINPGGVKINPSSMGRMPSKGLSGYNASVISSHPNVGSPRNSPINTSRYSYTTMSSYPGSSSTNNVAPTHNQYYHRINSARASRPDVTPNNSSKVIRKPSQTISNTYDDPHQSYDQGSRLETIVQDLQFTLQRRSAELQKKNSIIHKLEIEIDNKNCIISNLERENEQLKSYIKRKGLTSKISAASKPSSADNNYYRKLPNTPATNNGSSSSGHNNHHSANSRSNKPPNNLTVPQPKNTMGGKSRLKRMAISGESAKYLNTNGISTKRIEKPAETKELITNAIFANDYMKHLESSQIQEIVDCMSSVSYHENSWIIQEGEVGSIVYVLEEGFVDVTKNQSHIREMGPGTVFGELAILYNCQRTASVKAITNCKLWAIDRQSFQSIMMKSGLRKQEEYIQFLKSVPTFQDMTVDILGKIAGVLGENHYQMGEYIIREGAKGDTFYIIEKGRVKVTKKSSKTDEEIFIRYLDRGSWFGEKALRDEDVRTANIVAESQTGVDCLVLDRDSYNLLLGDIVNFDKQYPDDDRAHRRTMKFQDVLLRDLVVITTLGVGGFGRVELVRIGNDDRKTFALKVLKKHHIVETRQQEHVMNERDILMEVDSEFIVKLYKTYKDRRYLYMLMEVCLGGEVWTILREKIAFDDNTTKFYTASVVLALEYLHRKGIVFRDLKPENCLLDEKGFCKLTDFGFAKKIGFAKKTWTFCGTPEYVAPEIILNKGHDFAVDVWSLGILMYELLIGTPPFSSSDPMKTYNIILKGISGIDFPPKITRHAHSLIKKLCRENPSERLGYGKAGLIEIKKNVWFEGFNWDGLFNKKLKPPILPEVKSSTDVSNFDLYSPDDETPPEDISGWDKEF